MLGIVLGVKGKIFIGETDGKCMHKTYPWKMSSTRLVYMTLLIAVVVIVRCEIRQAVVNANMNEHRSTTNRAKEIVTVTAGTKPAKLSQWAVSK